MFSSLDFFVSVWLVAFVCARVPNVVAVRCRSFLLTNSVTESDVAVAVAVARCVDGNGES